MIEELFSLTMNFSVTSKFEAYMRAFGGIPTHEVNELYVNPRDTGHFLNVIQKEVIFKSKLNPHCSALIALFRLSEFTSTLPYFIILLLSISHTATGFEKPIYIWL